MIRKNAVESILAERDILITVRNPFVVSGSNLLIILFYSMLLQETPPCSNISFNIIRFGFSILLHVARTCILSWSI